MVLTIFFNKNSLMDCKNNKCESVVNSRGEGEKLQNLAICDKDK